MAASWHIARHNVSNTVQSLFADPVTEAGALIEQMNENRTVYRIVSSATPGQFILIPLRIVSGSTVTDQVIVDAQFEDDV